jgi:L-asparaginase II
MSTTLTGLARSFRQFGRSDAQPQVAAIAAAVRSHPEFLSGTRRDERELMAGVPGLIAKVGAEAVYGVALPDGRALAVKIDDGGDRARIVVTAEILRSVLDVDATVVHQQSEIAVMGGGRRVGQVHAVLG